MTKYSKIRKSSFAILALSLILVAILAFGGTYAYFSASVTSATETVTAGTLTLNQGSADAFNLTDTTKIVPNQTIDMTDTLGAVTIEGNTVSALRIRITDVTVEAADGKTIEETEYKGNDAKLHLTMTTEGDETWTSVYDDANDETILYYNLAVAGTAYDALYTDDTENLGIATLADAIGDYVIGLTLDADAMNNWQGAEITFSITVEATQAEWHDTREEVVPGTDISSYVQNLAWSAVEANA